MATSISSIQNQKYPKNAMNVCADTNFSSSHIINLIHGSVMFMQSHFQGWSFWHLYWRILDHLGVDIVKSVKVFQLHKLTIDCHAGRGDGSRISHSKLSYQILHEISSSLLPGVLDFHKCPLLCGVMRPNHLFFPRLHRSNIIGTPGGQCFLKVSQTQIIWARWSHGQWW